MNDYVDIIGYEKLYAINKEGSVWSYIRNIELKPRFNARYYRVNLYKDGKHVTYLLHRLLALQFLPNPLQLPFIDHINRIKTDNRLENLRWADIRQNANNRKDNTLHPLILLKPSGNYKVLFKVNGKTKHFGTYKSLDEALSERDCHLDLHGLENYCYGFTPTNQYP